MRTDLQPAKATVFVRRRGEAAVRPLTKAISSGGLPGSGLTGEVFFFGQAARRQAAGPALIAVAVGSPPFIMAFVEKHSCS